MSTNTQVVDIHEDMRTDSAGNSVSAATVLACVNYKLAYPTASPRLIGNQLGLDNGTVSRALRTPYAQSQLAILADNPFHLALSAAVGDGVVYAHKAIEEGTKALSADEPNHTKVGAANTMASMLLKGTVVPTKLSVEHKAIDANEFIGLEELELAIEQGGETGAPGSDKGEESPPVHKTFDPNKKAPFIEDSE